MHDDTDKVHLMGAHKTQCSSTSEVLNVPLYCYLLASWLA